MKNLARIAAAGLSILAASSAMSPSFAARYRTPDPKQSDFFEQLQKGQRPSTRRPLTAAQKRKLFAAPKTSNLVSMASVPLVSTTFYFSAHPDDFTLFMYPYRDVVLPDARVVFVFVTAGDAGLGKGPTGKPYYLARENGSLRGVRFMADAKDTTTATPTSGRVTVNGHSIQRTAYKNTVTYFLRLPDGNGDGAGFAGTGNVSLLKLKNSQISRLTAVDGSTSYVGWTDLVTTLKEIVRTQAVGTWNVWLNTHETDLTLNPGDHADHILTGMASEAIQPILPCVNLAYHVGYSTTGLVNMDADEALNKTGIFANYASGMAEKGYSGAAWDDVHKSWLRGLNYRILGGNWQGCAF